MKHSPSKLATILLPAALLTSCNNAPGKSKAVASVDSAGVSIIRSEGLDRELKWQFDPVAHITATDSSPAGLFDPSSGRIRVDSAGRIYVLDFRRSRVLVFDSAGRFQRSQGRKGSGPGEFRFALSLTVSPDGTTSMFDSGKRRLVRFGPGGEILDEEDFANGYNGGTIETTPSGTFYTSFDFRSRAIRQVSGDSSITLVERLNPSPKPVRLESCNLNFAEGLPPIFAPLLSWDARGDRLVAAVDEEYDIHEFKGTRETRRIRRALPPRAATAELAAKEIGDGMRNISGAVICKSQEVAEKLGFVPTIQAIRGLALAPTGEIWVMRGGVKGESFLIDVLSGDGSYLGTLPPGSPFPEAFLTNDRFVALAKDELDLATVVVYHIRR